MDWYINFVIKYPIISSMIQFAILGTLGEIISHKIKGVKGYPFTFMQTLLKMLGWMFLAILIKYAFKGFTFFVDGLATHNYLFGWMQNYERLIKEGVKITLLNKVGFAFMVSFVMNALFGPMLMILHRVIDNLIDKKKGNYKGLDIALKTLVWFWIPAHTITFCLPGVYRIGLAAVWGVVLGMIMGFASKSVAK